MRVIIPEVGPRLEFGGPCLAVVMRKVVEEDPHQSLTLAEVADRCGFDNPYCFSKTFKHSCGAVKSFMSHFIASGFGIHGLIDGARLGEPGLSPRTSTGAIGHLNLKGPSECSAPAVSRSGLRNRGRFHG